MILNRQFKIFSIAGIPVKLHWTFFLLFIYIPFIGHKIGLSPQALFVFGLSTVSIFTCVLLHEFGHALVARRFGIETDDIILTPIGGIARLTKMPSVPIQEIIVALAGPLVNVILAALIFIYLNIVNQELLPNVSEVEFLSHLVYYPVIIFWINVTLLLFNLIPAFPMDGGRVLRALLNLKMHRVKATRIASVTGQILAVCFLIIGIWQGQYSLPFIGIFIFLSARNESNNVRRNSFLKETKIADFIRTDYIGFKVNDTMDTVINIFENHSDQQDFIVINNTGNVIGVLHQEYIEEARARGDTYSTVQSYLSNHYLPIYENQNLQDVFLLFQKNQYSITPVYSNNYELLGVVDRNMLMKIVNRIK